MDTSSSAKGNFFMRDVPVLAQIDLKLCDGCARCAVTCRPRAIAMQEKKASHNPELCMGCLHCEAICPHNAIKVAFGDEDALKLRSIPYREEYVAPGKSDVMALVNLMRSRRSCSSYLAKPVAREVLDDLVKIGMSAPSGSNNQLWTYHILAIREAVMACGEATLDFFRRLNAKAANPLLRTATRLVAMPALHTYYQNYYPHIKENIELWEKHKVDKLFHGATAVILIGSKPNESCPCEDANLAAQNIMLGAHALGLGSCFIGFVTRAMSRDQRIHKALGIPPGEHIYAAIALGYLF